ncbi:hypothetical protein BD770DRAFT_397842, partial [Pilaira anomala]
NIVIIIAVVGTWFLRSIILNIISLLLKYTTSFIPLSIPAFSLSMPWLITIKTIHICFYSSITSIISLLLFQ